MAANGAAGGPHSGRDMTPAESAQRLDRMAEERVASSLSQRKLRSVPTGTDATSTTLV